MSNNFILENTVILLITPLYFFGIVMNAAVENFPFFFLLKNSTRKGILLMFRPFEFEIRNHVDTHLMSFSLHWK